MRFVISAEDRPDSLELRKATRPAHLDYMGQFPILVGGPMLDDDGNPCGSTLIIELDSLQAAHDFAANDPYAIAGLFERTLVREFMTVTWPEAE